MHVIQILNPLKNGWSQQEQNLQQVQKKKIEFTEMITLQKEMHKSNVNFWNDKKIR